MLREILTPQHPLLKGYGVHTSYQL